MSGARTLYLSYDGLTDPLGQSQVLPYLKGLSLLGHRITIISCEKPDAMTSRESVVAELCAAAGIDWHPLPYRKEPPILSTLSDLAAMRRLAFRLHKARDFQIVHCRSYLTALIGLALQRREGLKFLFDMRGFWIDERFERGIWPRGNPAYEAIARFLGRKERQFFGRADAVVSLTHAAKSELGRRGGEDWLAKTSVIPCCVDLDLFDPDDGSARKQGRALLGIDGESPILLFLGSLGGAYPLAPVLRFFRTWANDRAGSRLLFVTRHAEQEIRAHPDTAGLGDQLIVRAGERNEVPALVAAADAGMSFILPSYCAIASSPTKVGEMLAMGLPVAANDGVGDMALVLAEPGAGSLLADLEIAAVDAAAIELRDRGRDVARSRKVAEKWFALSRGVETYDSIYRGMIGR